MDGKWTVVSSDKNKKKANGQTKQSKAERKKLLENMPHPNFMDPMISAQVDLNKKERNVIKGDDNEIEFKHIKNSPKHTKPKKHQQQNQTKRTAEQTLASFSRDHVKELYQNVCGSFPDQPTICLSDLAAHLNREFDPHSEKDPTYAQYPSEFPMNMVKSDVIKALKSIIDKQSKSTLSDFVTVTLKAILIENGKDLPTFGHRLMIQLILRAHPTIILDTMSQNIELMKANRSSTNRFLMLAWCFNQASIVNFEVGCRVLMDLLMPYVNVKGISEYVLQFAEDLFKQRNAHSGALTYRDFFPFLDLIYALPPESSLPGNVPEPVMRRLKKIYPIFKKYAFLEQAPKNFKDYIPSLHFRLDPQRSSELNNELLLCLQHCLIKNSQCFVVLTQVHSGSEKKTNLVLSHLVKNWNTLKTQIKGQDFDSALKYFAFNQTAPASGSIEEKVSINGQILLEAREPGKSIKCFKFVFNMVFLVIAVMCLLLAVDILQCRGVWIQTRTYKFLVESKMMPVLEDLGRKSHAAFLRGQVMIVAMWQRASPYLIVLYQHISTCLHSVWTKCEPVMNSLWSKASPVIASVRQEVDRVWPIVLEKMAIFGHQVFDYISMLITSMVNFVQRFDWGPIIAQFQQFYATCHYYVKTALDGAMNRISS